MKGGFEKEDYKVKVGAGECEIKALTDNMLECQPPLGTPAKLQSQKICPGDHELAVVVSVVEEDNFAGCVKYNQQDHTVLIVVLTTVLAVLLAVGTVVVWWFVKKRVAEKKISKELKPQLITGVPFYSATHAVEMDSMQDSSSDSYRSKSPSPIHSHHQTEPNFNNIQQSASFYNNFNIPKVLKQGLRRTAYDQELPHINSFLETSTDTLPFTADLQAKSSFNSNTQTTPFQGMARAAKRISYTRPIKYHN